MKIWKEIENTNGSYVIDTNGEAKSLNRKVVSANGKVMSFKERVLKPQLRTDGYLVVSIYTNNGIKKMPIHRIVANTFIPNPNKLPFVCHRNDNKIDNRKENLFWGTHDDNMEDMSKKGRSGNIKLSPQKVIEIRKLLNLKVSQYKIAEDFNVTRNCICQIQYNQTYKTVIST